MLALCLFVTAPSAAVPPLWDAFTTLGADPAESVARLDAVEEAALTLATEVSFTPDARTLLDQIRATALELDLGKLYRLLPEASAPAHGALFSGTPSAGAYAVSLGDTPRATPGLGAFDAVFEMAPSDVEVAKRGRSFAIQPGLTVGLGAMEHQDLLGVCTGLLTTLHKETSADDADVDATLLTLARTAFPTWMAQVDPLVAWRSIGTRTDAFLLLDLEARLELTPLHEQYPALARWIENLDDLLSLEVVLLSPDGVLGTFAFESEARTVNIGLVTADGALIPRAPTGPLPDKAVTLSSPSLQLAMVVQAKVRTDGLAVGIADLRLPISWSSNDGAAVLSTRFTESPGIDVGGTNVVSNWLAEVADSALGLENQATSLFQTAAHGREGQGSLIEAAYTDGEQSVLTAHADALLLDNALVRFAMKIVGRHLTPSDAVFADIHTLMGDWIRALSTDYRGVRKQLSERPKPG